MTVGLVFVSHSARIAEGLVDLASQMAPDVVLVAAGGMDDGGIGTSAGLVEAGIRRADQGDGVLVIGDLGSAILTAETVVDLLDDAPDVIVLDAPLVEGGVAAAVAAAGGADLHAVARAASGEVAPPPSATPAVAAEGRVALTDPDGLHARPAALLVATAARFDARITVDGADARSMLAVLALGLRRGTVVTVRAEGADAAEALAAVLGTLGGPAS